MRKFPLACKSAFRFCTFPELGKSLTKEEWEAKEKEWSETAVKRNQEQLNYLNSKLTDYQKKKVELLAKTCMELDQFEFQCLFQKVNQDINQSTGVSLVDLNPQWPIFKKTEFSSWPPKSKEELDKAVKMLWGGKSMADLGQLFAGSGSGVGGAGAPQLGAGQDAAQGGKQAAPAAKEVEKVTEKTNYDLELASYDASKKILITKEVRQILNLGLKEAKDMVDKAPCTLAKGIKKEDAETLKKKLEDIGCKINLL